MNIVLLYQLLILDLLIYLYSPVPGFMWQWQKVKVVFFFLFLKFELICYLDMKNLGIMTVDARKEVKRTFNICI